MKFIISCVIFSFLISISVQAQSRCSSYKVVVPLDEQLQEWVDWCTFAASRVVTSHYGLSKSQCELVSDVVGHPCCPPTDSDDACHPRLGTWPHDVFSKVDFRYKPLPYLETPPKGPPSWGDIVSEICDHNRPLLAVIATLDSRNWHTVVVEAYFDDDGWYKVRMFDPIEDMEENPTFKPYDVFYLSGYEHHTDYMEIAPIDGAPSKPRNLIVR
jgi:hypothetical protein